MAKLFELSLTHPKGTIFVNPHMFAAKRAGVILDSLHEAGLGSRILDAAYAGRVLTDTTITPYELNAKDNDILDEVIAAMPSAAAPQSEIIVEIPDRIPSDMVESVRRLGNQALASIS